MRRYETLSYAILVGLLISVAPVLTRQALAQASNTCQPGQELISMPEIRSENGRLRAEITMTSGRRTLWGSAGDPRCVAQDLRYFKGRNLLKTGPEDPAFSRGEPIPGPTLRARVGDLIQIKFLNLVDTQLFANSLDASYNDPNNTTGCDEVYTDKPPPDNQLYPGKKGDKWPNCLHGSSTSNLHFHGTHTTPGTTGDNILLFIRPALRSGRDRKIISPNAAFVDKMFAQIFSACEKFGTPTQWQQLPAAWRADQERLLKEFDKTTPFRGKPGGLPPSLQLWPENRRQIREGDWPQYQIGAYPYCFRLADSKNNVMGQSPGTHWYHAHKHGSTALNVANGMTGAFVIEGQYDVDLRKFYGQGFRDQVLMIQQLSSTPFPVLNPDPQLTGPNTVAKPQLSINGRLNPVVKMRPGEVQLWRLVNGAFRDAVQLQGFAPQGGLAWRQIAQDGVQFAYATYQTLGAMNQSINLAPANRVDLLVKAPIQTGQYTLTAQPNAGLPLQCLQGESGCENGLSPKFFGPEKNPPITLLTVSVEGQAVSPAQDFIQNEADFPALPAFLADIAEADIHVRREVDFGATHNKIDGQSFDQGTYSQVMRLNSAEEWKISNEANDKSHPFHIHVNPFQITEVFAPNAENISDPNKPCYVDRLNPQRWKPCMPLTPPYVWWDTFAIPTSTQLDVTTTCQSDVKQCPAAIQSYVQCKADQNKKIQCLVTIPGYFKMRSRFVDFTGTYVLHCHILIHEDRGMMQLVEVVPGKSPYAHH
jgi:FtsP/CotA-like multicopper oxidase with cupredoxin domain